MFSKSSIKTKKQPTVKTGSLIIAQPFWQDERYKRSVIIIVDHSDAGSTGIILNKVSQLAVDQALPELQISPPLYFGGPIHSEMISFMHRDETIPESLYLGNELFCGGNYEYLQERILNKQIKMRQLKFYSGSVQWSAGQLEAEIRDNKWWTSEITAQEFFETSVDELWTHELLTNGHIYGLLNEFPDPCMS